MRFGIADPGHPLAQHSLAVFLSNKSIGFARVETVRNVAVERVERQGAVWQCESYLQIL